MPKMLSLRTFRTQYKRIRKNRENESKDKTINNSVLVRQEWKPACTLLLSRLVDCKGYLGDLCLQSHNGEEVELVELLLGLR